MNIFKKWKELDYCNPNELEIHLPHLTKNEVNEFYKSLKLKKNKIPKVKKNENEMKNVEIDFTKSILDFYN